jgi:hypothetical protein
LQFDLQASAGHQLRMLTIARELHNICLSSVASCVRR